MGLKSFLGLFLAFFGLGTLIFFEPALQGYFQGQIEHNKAERLVQALMEAPEIHLNRNGETSKTKANCHYYNCFDVYKCGGHLKNILVHISDPQKVFFEGRELAPMTKDFVDVLEAIAESDYYTEDPGEACIFVPPLNLMNEAQLDADSMSRALANSPNWNEGINNLLMSFVTGLPDGLRIDHGSAMIGASGLSSFSYRSRFDVALPYYTTMQEEGMEHNDKKFMLVVAQGNDVHPKFLPLLGSLSSKKNVGSFHPMDPDNEAVRIDQDGRKIRTIQALASGKFCLVAREKYGRLSTSFLMASMRAGCVPVIVIDSLVLPFSEVLDWRRFSIRFYEHDVDKIYDFVEAISEEKLKEMQAQVRFVYDKYFKDLKTITRTTLDILNDRVFTQHAKTYRDWNVELDTLSPLFMKNVPPADEGFTAVILTYDRLDSLFQVIKSVADAPSLSKILIVWNNQIKSPPPMSEWPTISKPLKIIRTSANLLTNRFYPFEEITTEAVLSMDDDIVMLTSDELEFAYQVWREFPDRLVGFPSRTHVWNNVSQNWRYESEWTNDVSMVLTGAAFYNKYWHYVFSTEGQEIKSWLDQRMNCEDIAMNFLIANATGKAPIKVTPRKKFKCSTPKCTNVDMLSNYQSHLVERSECINYLVDKYGYMPLKKAEFRADPVLFKDKFPEKLKNFVNIGSL